ncbi:hypothetical protein OTU49_012054, partial [Cherax quadricarinatus]
MYIYRCIALVALLASVGQPQALRQRNKHRQARPMDKSAPSQPLSTRQGDVSSSCLEAGQEVSFELITGFVYSSADDIIDSKIGTLLLGECIEFCRNNPRCQALNFETGLCVLFKTAAGENSASLAVSQFPVFTLYAQKVCLRSGYPVCASPWAYETVPGL